MYTLQKTERQKRYSLANDKTMQNEVFSNFSTSLKGSASRLGRMAQQGNKVAILKLAGILIVMFLILYWIGGWVFGGKGKA